MITLSTFTAISKRLPYITSTMWARGFILSLLVVGLAVAGDRLAPHLPQMEAWVEAQGAWGPLYLIGFGMVLSVFCLPLDLLALAGGAVFGLPEAAVYVIAGLYLGQCLDYAIGRFFSAADSSAGPKPAPACTACAKPSINPSLACLYCCGLPPCLPHR